MRRLLEWCRKRGLTVELGEYSSYVHETRVITIGWRLSRQRALFQLLHECGHHLCGRSGTQFAEGWGDARTPETRIAVVYEEIEAWDRGRRLARRLGIRLNRSAWAKERSTLLRGYMKWAAFSYR